MSRTPTPQPTDTGDEVAQAALHEDLHDLVMKVTHRVLPPVGSTVTLIARGAAQVDICDGLVDALLALSPQPHTSDVLFSPVGELLREAGELFREYEAHYREKVMTPDRGLPAYAIAGPNTESIAKAERNADIAVRIEAALAPPPADAIREPVSSDAGEDAT